MNEPPLANKLRPQKLEEFYGQEHLVGKNGILKTLIESDQLVSMIFWGPPGCGKTTLAKIIAETTKSYFVHFSAVTATLDDIRKTVALAEERLKLYNQKTILFLDEIHRFNKAQQDALLPHVEKGTVVLIGATTENPSFEITSPLLSRCRVVLLKRLEPKDLEKIIDKAVTYLKREISKDAKEFLIESANGDARFVLNTLEVASRISKEKIFKLKDIENALQHRRIYYDRNKEEHYNTISAYIKSMRASDVNAALYYLARMVEAGEDPLFIARRMVIFASEDIGMAQPTALVIANEIFKACEEVGYPECQIILAFGTVYLSLAKKDRSAYNAYFSALDDVKRYGNLSIPLKLRNAPTKLMKEIGYGNGYTPYPPKGTSLLPEKIKGRKYYNQK